MTPPASLGSSLETISRLARCSRLLDLPAHADLGGVGHVDQETAGQGDLRGDPAALGANGLLGHLYREVLPLLEDVLDVGQRARTRSRAAFLRHRSSNRRRRCLSRAADDRPPRQLVRRSLGFLSRPALPRPPLARIPAPPPLAVPFFLRLLVFVRLQQIRCVEEGAFLLPISTKAAWMPGSTASTRPR